MLKKIFEHEINWWILSIILGTGFAYYLFSPLMLEPTNINLLPYQDMKQQFIGLHAYFQDSWHWPLTYTYNIVYPHGVAINFIDGIPLLAIILKILAKANLLPDTFILQPYLVTINCILQFYCGSLIFRVLRKDYLLAIMGGLFILTASIFAWRILKHNTLTCQWLLLLAIVLVFKPVDNNYWRDFAKQLALVLTAIGIHVYLLVMIFLFTIVHLYKIYVNSQLKMKQVTSLVIILIISMLATFYLLGYFSMGSSMILDGGYGNYALNLIYPFYPVFNSLFFPAFVTHVIDGYEGMCYLGLGMLLLILLLLSTIIVNKRARILVLSMFADNKLMLILCVGLLLFSISTTVAFANYTIIKLPTVNFFLFNALRSSGRLVWPIFYLVMVAVTLAVYDIFKRQRLAYLIIALALVIQLADLSPLFKLVHDSFMAPRLTDYHWDADLSDPFWHRLKDSQYRHLVSFMPGFSKFGFVATLNDMTIGPFYLSRWDNAISVSMENSAEQFLSDNLQPETIYVVPDTMLTERNQNINQAECLSIDNYNVCRAE